MTGQTYMLSHDEELWPKELPQTVETLIGEKKDPLADRFQVAQGISTMPHMAHYKPRDKTRVVTFRVPHNAAVQIYDYKHKKSR